MHGEERSVELRLPEMKLDLGGIAKGFAADEALAALQHMGIDSALVNAGGEVVASGPPPELAGWRVGIVPVDPGEPERFLRIHHAAVATSGDAWQFVEIDGIRYSHILDPKTGLGLTKRRQATVVASDGMTADCLASALVVLGPEKGIALSDAWKDVEGLIIEVNAGRQTEHLTEGMAKCFVDREAPRKP
jgi:thiamine biosynthesis lipoprotein